ncbi:hypothetical protein B296_00026639 [Ensete ventricosum]|uniref:Retrotransposon gag domain-containing protein n=1 Tax=Ensete ventricosum TaxID=4639 RepID=A0A426YE18_ENSVE|nr:hypothetical protein B296_00026639 [Ensete ventricosum]
MDGDVRTKGRMMPSSATRNPCVRQRGRPNVLEPVWHKHGRVNNRTIDLTQIRWARSTCPSCKKDDARLAVRTTDSMVKYGGMESDREGEGLKYNAPAHGPELYDGSCDLTEHIVAFRAQMALYDTSDALMCRAFPTTLRGPTKTWYCHLKPASISSFDLLAKEFELNFLVSARPKPTTASLLRLAQGSDESLSQFVGRFTSQVQGIPDVHPSLAIQAFFMGLKPSKFFWSLIEQSAPTVPEMLQRAHQYMAAETLVAGKRDESKCP